jgi:hypothetical protein
MRSTLFLLLTTLFTLFSFVLSSPTPIPNSAPIVDPRDVDPDFDPVLEEAQLSALEKRQNTKVAFVFPNLDGGRMLNWSGGGNKGEPLNVCFLTGHL